MEKIKVCPFCGGDASVHGNMRAFVKCDQCGARGFSYRYIIYDEDDKADAVKAAIKAWNRRTDNG